MPGTLIVDEQGISEQDLEAAALEGAIGRVGLILRNAIERTVDENPSDYVDVLTPAEDTADPTLAALKAMETSIRTGQDLQGEFSNIRRLIGNQENRAKIIDALLNTHDMSRLVKFLSARDRIESIIVRVAMQGQLTMTENLAFLQFLQTEIKAIQTRNKSTSVGHDDVLALLSTLSVKLEEEQTQLETKFSTTSPQNREIIRRLGYDMLRVSGAKKTGDSD